MKDRPVAGEVYRHFKNKEYKIIAIALHSETNEELVIYEALYGEHKIYARPMEMFISEVDHVKYPDVKQKYRFEKVAMDVNQKMMAFFDTEDLEERYQILTSMQYEITNQMIDNMAVVMDLIIPDGELMARYDDLKRAIATKQKYEQKSRFR